MKRFFRSKGFKNLVCIAVVVFLGVLMAAFTHNASSPITSAVGTIFLPLQKLSAEISDSLEDISFSFESSLVYAEENAQLKKELAEIKAQRASSEKVKAIQEKKANAIIQQISMLSMQLIQLQKANSESSSV